MRNWWRCPERARRQDGKTARRQDGRKVDPFEGAHEAIASITAAAHHTAPWLGAWGYRAGRHADLRSPTHAAGYSDGILRKDRDRPRYHVLVERWKRAQAGLRVAWSGRLATHRRLPVLRCQDPPDPSRSQGGR